VSPRDAAPSALFLLSGASKLVGHEKSLEMRDHLEVGARVWRAIGAVEVVGAVSLLLGRRSRSLGLAGGGSLTLISVGAVASHIRADDPATQAAPALAALAMCLAATAGASRQP
jgi:uncharacterized membrane protein YkgB